MMDRGTLNRKAHALAAKLDMDHQALSDFACVEYSVPSMSKLTHQNYLDLVFLLHQATKNIYRISTGQRNEIYRICYHVLQWKSPDIKGFIKRQTKQYKSVQDLTPEEATKVIHGLRVMERTVA